MPHARGQFGRHRRNRSVRSGVHRLGLADDVLGPVEHLVDPTGELEDVLRLQRRRECLGQRHSQLPLPIIRSVLASSQPIRRRGVARSPRTEEVDSLDGDRRLLVEHAEDIGDLREEPVPPRSQTATQIDSISAPSAADAGRVSTQARAIDRTTAQRT